MSKDKFPSRHVDPAVHPNNQGPADDDEEEEKEFDLISAMNEMALHERRKVYAMKGLLGEYKAARAKFREELALLQVNHLRAAQRLQDIRSEIISGARDITDEEISLVAATEASGVEEIPSDEEKEKAGEGKKSAKSVRVVAPKEEKNKLSDAAASPNGGIPDFWITAMGNTEVLDSMIMERDRHALSFLKNVSMEYVEGDPQKGVQINFYFDPNEYFTNEVLTKTFCMSFDEDSGEMEIDSMKATPIQWKSPEKNLTVTIKKKKQRHKNGKDIRVVNREEKCPSFFGFFTDPLPEDENEEQDDEEAEEAEAEAELHIEAGQLLMEEIIPKAAFFYTGKSVEQVAKALQSQFGSAFHDDDDDEEKEEEEEEEEEEVPVLAARGGRGGSRGYGAGGASHNRNTRGGARGRKNNAEQQQCKQQ